jgi:hypothetical protein
MGDNPPLAFYDDVHAMFEDAWAVPLLSSPSPTPISCFPFRVDSRVDSLQKFDENEIIGNAVHEQGNEDPLSRPFIPAAAANGASSVFNFPAPHDPKPKTENKKKRNCCNLSIDTNIFINAENQPSPPVSTNPPPKKKTKHTGRTPLSEISGNNSPTPNYLNPITGFPFPFNSEDPNFEETENFCYTQTMPRPSPIARPQTARPRTRAQRRARSYHSRSHTAPAFGSFPYSSVAPDPIPVCMVLYNLLEIKDYKASGEAIKVAYKKMGLIYHPDKVKDEVCVYHFYL